MGSFAETYSKTAKRGRGNKRRDAAPTLRARASGERWSSSHFWRTSSDLLLPNGLSLLRASRKPQVRASAPTLRTLFTLTCFGPVRANGPSAPAG